MLAFTFAKKRGFVLSTPTHSLAQEITMAHQPAKKCLSPSTGSPRSMS